MRALKVFPAASPPRGRRSSRGKLKLQCDELTWVSIATTLVLVAAIVVCEIATADLKTRKDERISRGLLWSLGKLNRDHAVISTVCSTNNSDAAAALTMRFSDFKQKYLDAKQEVPAFKAEAKLFRDYEFVFFGALGEPSIAAACSNLSFTAASAYDRALSRYRWSIGDTARKQRTIATIFDILVSVLALSAGVGFTLLALGSRRQDRGTKQGAEGKAKETKAAEEQEAAQGLNDELSIIHMISVAAVIANKDMKIVDVNEAALAIFGYEEKTNLVDNNVTILMPNEMAEKHSSYVEFYFRTGTSSAIGLERCVPVVTAIGTEIELIMKLVRVGPEGNPRFAAFFRDASTETDVIAAKHFADVTQMYEELELLLENKLQMSNTISAHADMLRNLSVPVIVANESMTILEINESASRIFGYEQYELKGENVKALMFENVSVKHDSYVKRHLTTGVNRIIGSNVGRKVEGRAKSGKPLQLVLNVGKTITYDGETRFTAILQDITDLMAKVKEIEQEKDRTAAMAANQQNFLHNLAVGVVVADETMEIIDVNAALLSIFGYEEQDLIGQNVKILMPPGDLKDRHDDIVATHLRTGQAKIIGSFEGRRVTGRHSSGTALELVINVAKSHTSDDPPRPRFTAVFQDVTPLMAKVKQIEEERGKIASIVKSQKDFLNNLAVGVIVADQTMAILEVNVAARNIFGYEENELQGKNVKILIPPGSLQDRHDDIVANYIRTGEAKIIGSYEGRKVVGRHSSGSKLKLIINVSKSYTLDEPRQPVFTAVFQNLTPHKPS